MTSSVNMINSTTYGNERDLDPFSRGVLFPKKPSSEKASFTESEMSAMKRCPDAVNKTQQSRDEKISGGQLLFAK